jgi:hypothetical protein
VGRLRVGHADLRPQVVVKVGQQFFACIGLALGVGW